MFLEVVIIRFYYLKPVNENFGEEIINGIYIKSLSQEHGVVHVSDELLPNYKVGDILYILPVHSCLTANCFKTYQLTSGEVIERF